MRIGRVAWDNNVAYAVIGTSHVQLLAQEPYGGLVMSAQELPLAQVRLLAPCVPSKIVAVGLNYRDHIAEMKDETPEDPVLFIKPSTCVIGPEDTILRPADAQSVDYEAEVAAVIGAPLRFASREQAKAAVLGFTLLNDVTARDIQKKDGQWSRGKSYDTFAPIGPWIETAYDPCAHRRIGAELNGTVRQDSFTDQMIHDPYTLISYISRCMTLYPGDVVTTGTPAGVGPMVAGDVVEILGEGIGSLRNPVADDPRGR